MLSFSLVLNIIAEIVLFKCNENSNLLKRTCTTFIAHFHNTAALRCTWTALHFLVKQGTSLASSFVNLHLNTFKWQVLQHAFYHYSVYRLIKIRAISTVNWPWLLGWWRSGLRSPFLETGSNFLKTLVLTMVLLLAYTTQLSMLLHRPMLCSLQFWFVPFYPDLTWIAFYLCLNAVHSYHAWHLWSLHFFVVAWRRTHVYTLMFQSSAKIFRGKSFTYFHSTSQWCMTFPSLWQSPNKSLQQSM